jgi:hypothetical protein
LKIYLLGRAHLQWPILVLTTRDGRLVPQATLFPVAALTVCRLLGADGYRLSPPHMGWPPLMPAPDVTEEAATHSSPPSHHSALPPYCSAPHRLPLCLLLPTADEPPPSCPTGLEGAPHHHRPPTPRACPQRPGYQSRAMGLPHRCLPP